MNDGAAETRAAAAAATAVTGMAALPPCCRPLTILRSTMSTVPDCTVRTRVWLSPDSEKLAPLIWMLRCRPGSGLVRVMLAVKVMVSPFAAA